MDTQQPTVTVEQVKLDVMKAYNWGKIETEKFLKGLVITVIASSLTYSTAYLSNAHLGVYGPLIMFVWANVVNSTKLFVQGA